ncbi:unnamed protein product [Rangifer tarandus platyrhynchus]|uniref:Uncharacterized protein n=1 Tax=Rangifer tarandus platyrhynchus TaxID=3082113 RepID=A0AC59Y6X5_RANTA
MPERWWWGDQQAPTRPGPGLASGPPSGPGPSLASRFPEPACAVSIPNTASSFQALPSKEGFSVFTWIFRKLFLDHDGKALSHVLAFALNAPNAHSALGLGNSNCRNKGAEKGRGRVPGSALWWPIRNLASARSSASSAALAGTRGDSKRAECGGMKAVGMTRQTALVHFRLQRLYALLGDPSDLGCLAMRDHEVALRAESLRRGRGNARF